MAWFFSRGKTQNTRPMFRKLHPECEPLENRLVFSANVWLPQQLNPIDGATTYDQSFQAYHTALGDLMPTTGMSSGVATLAGNFALVESGSYPLTVSATGPYGGSNSFEFDETGSSLFCLTIQGSVLAAGFTIASVVLTQTVSLVWQFLQKDSAGNVVQSSSGTEDFTLGGTPAAPFDPFFGAGFNWLGPTWRVSADNGLGLPSLAFAALTVTETGGTSNYTFQVTGGELAITGKVQAPLYQVIAQDGQESYSVAVDQIFGTVTQGSASFSLAEAGAYSAGSFALVSVFYSENGASTGVLTETTTRSDSGTGTAGALQNSSVNLHTFSSSADQSYRFTELDTLMYTEWAQVTYGLTQLGTFAGGQFSLNSLSDAGLGSGGFSLTLTRATTQTGTTVLTDSQAGTDSMAVAGTMASTGAMVEAGQFTLTAIDTISESESGLFTLSQLGAYGAGSWNLGTASNLQALSGTFSEQYLQTYTLHAAGTITNTGAGNDTYTLNYGSTQTTTGAQTSTLAETLTYASDVTETVGFSAKGTAGVTFSEVGAAQGGTYSLSSYVLSQSIAANQVTQDNFSETDTGTGTAAGTIATSGSDATQYGGTTGSALTGGSVYVNSAFSYTDAIARTGADTLAYAQSSYQAGTYGGSRLALSSVAYGDSAADTWSLSALDSSTATGSQTAIGTELGQVGGSAVLSGQTATGISIGTVNFTSTSNYTSTANTTVNQSGFTSWTDAQQGNYAGTCFAFGNAYNQGQGSFTSNAQAAQTQTYAATNLESSIDNSAQSQTSNLQITSSAGMQSAVNQSRQTVVESGTLTLAGSSTVTGAWSLYEKGSFSAGSWSLSSISYQESATGTSALVQTQAAQQSGTRTFMSTQTNISGGTAVYGGTLAGQSTYGDAVSGQTSLNETDLGTFQEQDAGSYSLAQQGVYSGQSYSFPTVTYQEQGNSLVTAAAAITVLSAGRSFETTTLQGAQTYNTNVGAYQSNANAVTETSTSSFSTAGTSIYQETATSADTWSLYELGSLAGDSLSLSSFNSSETTAATDCYQGTDSSSSIGSVVATTTGTQIVSIIDGAFISGTYGGAMTLTANFTTNAQDSYSGNGQQTASLLQLGTFSNFSYSLSSVVYQASDSFTQGYSDSGTSTDIGTLTDQLTGSASRSAGYNNGVYVGGYNGVSVNTINSSLVAQDTSSYADTFTSSGNDSLYEAGSFSGGSYSLSSVALTQSGTDSYSQSASETSTQVGQQTQGLAGTYTGAQTVAFGGGNALGGTVVFGNTITLGMTATGLETAGAQNSATLSGGDSWSLTMLGAYAGYSYSFGSVVYQGVQTQNLAAVSNQSAQFTGGNTKTAGESQLTNANITMGLNNANNTQDTLSVGDQDSSSATECVSVAAGSTYSWYYAGNYGGGVYTFPMYNETVSVSESSTATSVLSSTETVTLGANTSASSLNTNSSSVGSNTYGSQSSMAGGGTLSLQVVSSASGTFTLQGLVSYTQGEIGSYAAGDFAVTGWSYSGTQGGSYSNQSSRSLGQTLTANGTASNGAVFTNASVLAVVYAYGTPFTFGGGVANLATVTDANSSGQSTTFNGTITTGDTLILSEAGTYTLAATQNGSYAGGSFAFGSMTYSVNATRAAKQKEYSGFTATSYVTVSESSSYAHTGATPFDSYGDGTSDSFTRQDTVTNNTTATSFDNSTYSLYEAGSYAGQSWNLSSFNLLMQDNAASTFISSTTDACLITGGFSKNAGWGGQQAYDIVGGTFVESGSTTTITQNYSQMSYATSEQGTFSNGSFGLSSFAFLYAQASQQTVSAAGGAAQAFGGADDVGQGASNPTFTGDGISTVTYEDDQSSSSSLAEEGTFAGGSFNLSEVDYAGSSSDSYSAANDSASEWTGGYAGSETIASADSAANSQDISATGSFVAGSWSLSNYVLAGAAQQAQSDSHDQEGGLVSMGMVMDGSSFASSDASTGSSTLYQAGTQAAGNYANSSYSYQDSAAATMTADAQMPGMTAGQCWTELSASTVLLGGMQQDRSAATYTYQMPDGGGADANSGSAASAQPQSTPVVQFGTPDSTVVAQADNAQIASGALVGSPSSPLPSGGEGLGVRGQAAMTPGATAPVPVTVNLQLVPATGAWTGATLQASQQVINNVMTRKTLHGPEAAAGKALEAVVKRADATSFGMQAWQVVAPAMKLAMWIQADSMNRTLVGVLSLDDPGGQVAANFYRQTFVSESNDPLVNWVDKMLYNDGQPLTAGSAPLYGTYWDGQGRSAQEALSMVGPFWGAGVNIVAGMWIAGPSALIGVAGPALGAFENSGIGLLVNLLGGADASTIASDFGSQFFEGAAAGALGVLAGGAQSAAGPARGPVLQATMLEHGGGWTNRGGEQVRTYQNPYGRSNRAGSAPLNRSGSPPFNPGGRQGGGVFRMTEGTTRRAQHADLLEQNGISIKRIPPGNVSAEESYVYALTRRGEVIHYGTTNDPANRLRQHRQRFGPDVDIQLLSGPLPTPVAVQQQNRRLDIFAAIFGRRPIGNPIRN
jgi:hypothetical protein